MIGHNIVAYQVKQSKNTVTLADGTVIPYTVKKPRKRRAVYNHPRQLCMGARILDEIERRGGMTSTQIKKQLFEWSNPGMTYSHEMRGWWSSPLYGGTYSDHGDGLLKTFCTKQGKRWMRNSVPHNDHPFAITRASKRKNPWQAQPVFDPNTNAYIIQAVFNP